MDYYTLVNKDNVTENSYNTISTGFIEEKKSKFISYIFSINNKEEASKYIDMIKKDNKEARHVVYIYSFLNGNNVDIKFSDDGEPQGTGTRAIYELLTKEKITNICIVIVRYFGGILLGAGPLSRTYLNSAKEAILKCEKDKIYNYIEEQINTSYASLSSIEHICNSYDSSKVVINNVEYTDNILLKIKVREDVYDEIMQKINKINRI